MDQDQTPAAAAPETAPAVWQTPEVSEMRLGMEVTSYEGADIDTID